MAKKMETAKIPATREAQVNVLQALNIKGPDQKMEAAMAAILLALKIRFPEVEWKGRTSGQQILLLPFCEDAYDVDWAAFVEDMGELRWQMTNVFRIGDGFKLVLELG